MSLVLKSMYLANFNGDVLIIPIDLFAFERNIHKVDVLYGIVSNYSREIL